MSDSKEDDLDREKEEVEPWEEVLAPEPGMIKQCNY
jgi:hypothetical protein